MGFSRFRLNVFSRLVAVVATGYLLLHLLIAKEYYAAATVMLAAFIWQVSSLVRYLEGANSKLQQLLLAITSSDLSQSFVNDEVSEEFEGLVKTFEEVRLAFFQTRMAREEYAHYLQAALDNTPAALISLKEDGQVSFLNYTAKILLGIYQLRSINDLSALDVVLPNKIKAMLPGEKDVVKIDRDGKTLQLSLSIVEFRSQNRRERLVSLYNIKHELAANEIESWQSLIRVLTHEIMNSVTPIASLSSTALNRVAAVAEKSDDRGDFNGVIDALDTVAKRSEGLLSFVDKYRQFTQTPQVNIKQFNVVETFKRIERLLNDDLSASSIKFSLEVKPEKLTASADPVLIEQVLINIVRNAIEACRDCAKPQVTMMAKVDDTGFLSIRIANNGGAIKKNIRDKIFLPFYTTKRQGSGVGLSLSRQIVLAHNGTLELLSSDNNLTTFEIQLVAENLKGK